jgi:hypothetical protein
MQLYGLYWFYRQWRAQRERDPDIWPVPRAIFSIFFTHSLARILDVHRMRQQIKYQWAPELASTIYVAFMLVGHMTERLSDNQIGLPYTLIASTVFIPICAWAIWQLQAVANLVSDDKDGESNSTLTPANYIWIVLGILLWGFYFYSFTVA